MTCTNNSPATEVTAPQYSGKGYKHQPVVLFMIEIVRTRHTLVLQKDEVCSLLHEKLL